MTFDRLTLDAVNRASEVHVLPAGKSINVARVLKTIDQQPLCSGFVGGGGGKFIREHLDQLRIPHDFVILDEPTRVCVTVIDRATGNVTELVQEASAVSAAKWESLELKMRELIPRASMLILSGKLAAGAPAGWNGRCTRIASEHGVKTIVDARDESLVTTLEYKPFLVKPNVPELSTTVGRGIENDEQLFDATRELVERGAQWVAVTKGSEGALLSNGKQAWKIAAPKITVVSPIGSGDSFAAGFAAGIIRGLEMPEAARLAVACGAANALTPQAGLVHREDVERLVSITVASPWQEEG
jgi:tagatose 6-phosphate kinase